MQHFLDLCAVLGQPAPAEIDPKGDFYTFEKGVEKSGLHNPCPTGLATNLTTGRAEIYVVVTKGTDKVRPDDRHVG